MTRTTINYLLCQECSCGKIWGTNVVKAKQANAHKCHFFIGEMVHEIVLQHWNDQKTFNYLQLCQGQTKKMTLTLHPKRPNEAWGKKANANIIYSLVRWYMRRWYNIGRLTNKINYLQVRRGRSRRNICCLKCLLIDRTAMRLSTRK